MLTEPRRAYVLPAIDHREWLSTSAFLRRHPKVIGRNTLYGLIREGRIEVLRISPRKYLIPADALDRLYASETTVSA